jgi:hypothetical protein
VPRAGIEPTPRTDIVYKPVSQTRQTSYFTIRLDLKTFYISIFTKIKIKSNVKRKKEDKNEKEKK